MEISRSIEHKLRAALTPSYLQIDNESHLHHQSLSAESHFKIQIVADSFQNKSRLERHRQVQSILKEEILLIKAYSLVTLSPDEWVTEKEKKFRSPTCAGHE